MDITTIFKSSLEFVEKKNKTIGSIECDDTSSPYPLNKPTGKTKLFGKKKTDYHEKSKELLNTISSLRDFLQETRTPYLNLKPSGMSIVFFSPSHKKDQGEMSDLERDQIDKDVQKIIQNCQKGIFEFEKAIEMSENVRNNPQLSLHLENVISSLIDYLKMVCSIHSEMRAIRVKRTLDFQAMSRINHKKPDVSKSKYERTEELKNKIRSTTDFAAIDETPVLNQSVDEQLSPEELQIFEEENAMLLQELNTIADEVDQIQSSVVQIAQLQEIFTEKVLEQEKDIDKVATMIVGTTENIKGGNEQIRQAIQKNADFRVWLLFFIFVMSLSLLFLDWYND